MNKNIEYLRPESPMEACEVKAKYGPKARYLAGGTDLLLLWRRGGADLKYLIDLTFIDALNFMENSENILRIGTLTTLAAIEHAGPDNSPAACLSDGARKMCTPQTRNYATVGGNVCHASPAADMSVILVALNAKARILGLSGEKDVPMEDFFKGVNQTVLAENEMLMEIRVPVPTIKTKASFGRVGRTGVDLAQVNTAVSLGVDDGGVVSDAAIAMGAVAPVPIRSRLAEKMLLGVEISKIDKDLMEKVSTQAASDAKPITDIRASASYRKEMSRVLVRRSIEEITQKFAGSIS
ncbi:MAG: xanthine dehydrogenase family protein subunit M [Deltaproteobacteria bacterium]|nr:xanthine dehydrogenase family protein subunit M [Deltaproteobacteria bacterium]